MTEETAHLLTLCGVGAACLALIHFGEPPVTTTTPMPGVVFGTAATADGASFPSIGVWLLPQPSNPHDPIALPFTADLEHGPPYGEFRFEDVPCGEWRVRASKQKPPPGGYPWNGEREVTVLPGGDHEVAIKLR